MIDVSASDAQATVFGGPAARALAAGFYGAEVGGVLGVAKVEDPGGGDGVAKALKISISIDSSTMRRRRRTAVRVGQTQSNISAPSATETTKSSG